LTNRNPLERTTDYGVANSINPHVFLAETRATDSANTVVDLKKAAVELKHATSSIS
jgi:hypothetical protein